jgi:hypothetical protein
MGNNGVIWHFGAGRYYGFRIAVLDSFDTLTPAFPAPLFHEALLAMSKTLSLPDVDFRHIRPLESQAQFLTTAILLVLLSSLGFLFFPYLKCPK